jgi:hypothetical protein
VHAVKANILVFACICYYAGMSRLYVLVCLCRYVHVYVCMSRYEQVCLYVFVNMDCHEINRHSKIPAHSACRYVACFF